MRRFHEGLLNKSTLYTSNLIFRFPLRRFIATTLRCLFEYGCGSSQLNSSLTNYASNAIASVFIFSAVAEVSSAPICASRARFKAMTSQTHGGIVSSGETCEAHARYDICAIDQARSRKTARYYPPPSFWSIKDRFIIWPRELFLAGLTREIPSRHDRPIFLDRVANQNTGFASSCPLALPAM